MIGTITQSSNHDECGRIKSIPGLSQTTHDYEMAAQLRSTNVGGDHTSWTSEERQNAKVNADYEINSRANRLKNNLRKRIKTNKVHRGIIMAMVRLLALLFIIYKAFDIGYSKHILVDNPEKPNRCAAAAAEQSGGRRSKSGGAPRKPYAQAYFWKSGGGF